MKWYSAKIVFQIVVGAAENATEFDEQWILVEAENKEMAFRKATCMGVNKQDSFMNVQQQEVQWKFVNVAELNQLNELTDGSELYSQIKKQEDAEQYINSIHGKAAQLSNFNSMDWIQLL